MRFGGSAEVSVTHNITGTVVSQGEVAPPAPPMWCSKTSPAF